MRRPHYVQRHHATELPSNCIWVDTETQPVVDKEGREHHYLHFGWACYMRREKGLHWSQPEWKRFTTRAQFWRWALSKARQKTRLYLFAHNWAFDGPVLGAFSELPKRGFELTNAIVDAPPFVASWRCEKRTIKAVDTLNIWRVPLSVLGESIGIPKLKMPPKNASRKKWDAYGKNDTEIIRVACLRWFEFLVAHDLGGFSITLAAQAMTAYRHRFMHTPIFIDNNEKAIEVSREAYVGGRTECFKIGEYRGDFYYVDVNSMYPAVMAQKKFPTKLIGVYGRPNKKEIEKWRHDYGHITECIIETPEPIVPLVNDGKLVFPIGKFRVCLAKPEFNLCWERGYVSHIERIVLYEEAEIFKDFVEFFYEERLKAKAEGNPSAKFMHKILMNSLYGKFGQRGRRYEDDGTAPVDSIRVETEYDLDTGETIKIREFGGIRQRWKEEGESVNSFPAIAATVTAEARMVLLRGIETAKRRNVYYCDTDSMVVNAQGFKNIRGLLDDNALGAWALEKKLSYLNLRGPKDYEMDEEKKVKGVRANAKWLSDNTIEQDRFVGFKGLLREGSLDAPIVHPIKKTLSREYTKGKVLKSGSVRPLRINTA